MNPWPTIDEERLDAVRHGASGWRRHGIILSLIFFGLTALALFAFNSLAGGISTAAVAIALAEWLIRRKRFFGTGIESALWIGALVALITELPSSGKPEALLVFAAAFALAGFRVRSALLGCAATLSVLIYVAMKTQAPWPPAAFGMALTLIAAVALQREWQRPSTERLFAAVMIVMPVVAEIVWAFKGKGTTALAFAILAAVLFALGIRARDRVTLAAGALTAAIAAYELHRLFAYPVEAKLMTAGALLIAIAVAVTRALRGRTTGFVVEPSAVTPYDDAMQILATLPAAHVAPAPAAAAAGPEIDSGDSSSFGGAGAGGKY
jgi:hypothetical protein